MKNRRHERPEKRSYRRSLGLRISLSYAGYLLRTMLWQALVLAVVFWLCALMNASVQLNRAAEGWDGAGSFVLNRGVVSAAQSDLQAQRMFGRIGNESAMTIDVGEGAGEIRAAYLLTGEWQMFRALLIALILMEMARMGVLIRRGERISRRALRPITEIAESARRLSASNLSQRIEAPGARNELKELSGVLNDMLDRIESAYNSQKQFVSDASHELRTPIAVIQGYADMLDRWGKKDPEVMDESIAAIRSEAAGMKELVEQLLFLARHDNRTHQYAMVYLDAGQLVEETYRDTQLIAEGHVVRHGAIHRAIVYGDRPALKQALRIFVENAIKYTKKGGTITLSCTREEKFCRITVADTGQGVAEEELSRIFERFYRTESVRSSTVDGHGLGLSIARIIVRAHGGKIEVQSKKGVGSRFHILLPL